MAIRTAFFVMNDFNRESLKRPRTATDNDGHVDAQLFAGVSSSSSNIIANSALPTVTFNRSLATQPSRTNAVSTIAFSTPITSVTASNGSNTTNNISVLNQNATQQSLQFDVRSTSHDVPPISTSLTTTTTTTYSLARTVSELQQQQQIPPALDEQGNFTLYSIKAIDDSESNTERLLTGEKVVATVRLSSLNFSSVYYYYYYYCIRM